MSDLNAEDVMRLAALAKLSLSPQELELMVPKLNAIFGYFEVIKLVKVDDVEPMSHVHGSINIMRADVVQESMPNEELLKLAPDCSGRFIRTPLVIEG